MSPPPTRIWRDIIIPICETACLISRKVWLFLLQLPQFAMINTTYNRINDDQFQYTNVLLDILHTHPGHSPWSYLTFARDILHSPGTYGTLTQDILDTHLRHIGHSPGTYWTLTQDISHSPETYCTLTGERLHTRLRYIASLPRTYCTLARVIYHTHPPRRDI